MLELKANIINGEVKFVINEGQHAVILAKMAEPWAIEKARQEALEKTYTVKELESRMNMCQTSIYNAIQSEKLRAVPSGKKGYRVSELSVRQFFGDCD